jgi:pentatricopeptide repeat protein
MLQRGIEPNVVSFGAVINACAKASNLQWAEYWHHTMLEMGVKLGAGSFFLILMYFVYFPFA